MAEKMQNPGWPAGASRSRVEGWLQDSDTAYDWRAQMLVSRFRVSPLMARELARLCFGEARHD